jgi:hypothetical protein
MQRWIDHWHIVSSVYLGQEEKKKESVLLEVNGGGGEREREREKVEARDGNVVEEKTGGRLDLKSASKCGDLDKGGAGRRRRRRRRRRSRRGAVAGVESGLSEVSD